MTCIFYINGILLFVSWLDVEDPLDSDVTDYEDNADSYAEVESDEDTPVVVMAGSKRTIKEEVVEEGAPAPVQYNASKYYKKKKVCERVDVPGG